MFRQGLFQRNVPGPELAPVGSFSPVGVPHVPRKRGKNTRGQVESGRTEREDPRGTKETTPSYEKETMLPYARGKNILGLGDLPKLQVVWEK